MCRPCPNGGKADVLWEETGICTIVAAGVGDQASDEGLTEIASGKADSRQGLVTTCKDSPTKGRPEAVKGFWSGA